MRQNDVVGTKSSTSRKGSKEAKELDKLIEKGLGPNKLLSHDQDNCKFKHWKRAQISEKEFKQLDESKVENTQGLLVRLRNTDCRDTAN